MLKPAFGACVIRQIGDWLDARDSYGNWCVAQVVRIEGETMRVHFQGWTSKFDEDLRLESSKARTVLSSIKARHLLWCLDSNCQILRTLVGIARSSRPPQFLTGIPPPQCASLLVCAVFTLRLVDTTAGEAGHKHVGTRYGPVNEEAGEERILRCYLATIDSVLAMMQAWYLT